MIIQSSNPLSMLSGAESGGSGQQAALTDDGNIAAFTSNLMQQLALLQGNQAKIGNVDAGILADLQAKAGAIDGHMAGQEVQDFAALFGNTMPMAKKIDQNINLDDTLNALADVLQHLQDIGADATNPAPTQSPADGLNQTMNVKDQPVDTPAKPDQALDLAALAAAMQPIQPALQPEVVPAPATDQISGAMPSVGTAAGGDALLMPKKAMPSGNTAGTHQVFASVQGSNDKQQLALDGETASAFLNQGNASGNNAGQDKGATADDQTVLTDPLKSVDSDKNTSKMVSDIAQLNQAVKTEKTVEVPPMTRPISHPEWNQELGQKLIWMHKQDIPSAELRLNPQHLGPISIKIDVNQDQTTVSFTAQHAGVKDAIEAALPKLREMLGGQHLNLVDVNVSQQQSEQRQQPSDFFKMASEQGRGGNGQNNEAENPTTQATVDIVDEIESGRALASNGLLSLFA